MYTAKKQEHPEGIILVFTMGILALLAILGVTLFLATKNELKVAGDTAVGRDAFIKADFTTQLTAFLGEAALTTNRAGDLAELLSPGGVASRPGFVVRVHNFSEAGFQQLEYKNTEKLTKKRLLRATDGNSSDQPHVEIFYQYDSTAPNRLQLVGTAAVGFGLPDPQTPGMCLEDSCNDGVGSASVPYFLVINADGRIPTSGQNDLTPVTDPSNYYSGDPAAKHSIISAIYVIRM